MNTCEILSMKSYGIFSFLPFDLLDVIKHCIILLVLKEVLKSCFKRIIEFGGVR